MAYECVCVLKSGNLAGNTPDDKGNLSVSVPLSPPTFPLHNCPSTNDPVFGFLSLCVVHASGLWVELQLVYTGALQMTLQTKFNLSKLGKGGGQDTDCTTETGSTRLVLIPNDHHDE